MEIEKERGVRACVYVHERIRRTSIIICIENYQIINTNLYLTDKLTWDITHLFCTCHPFFRLDKRTCSLGSRVGCNTCPSPHTHLQDL